MKGLMEILGSAPESGDSAKIATPLEDGDTQVDGTSPDQKEAMSALASDCFQALKEGDQEGFADNLLAIIEMVR